MANSPLDNSDGPVGVTIKLNDSEIDDSVQIQSVRVRRAVNRIPEATFSIIADSAQLGDFSALDSDDFKLGTEVEIGASYGGSADSTIFNGIIYSTRLRADGSRGARMEVTCRDKALKLTEIRSSVSYLEVKDSDVMQTIVSDAGLSADIAATTAEMPLNLRVGATDWDFLRLLADRNGQVLTVDDGKISSHEIDTSGAAVLTLTFGEDIVALDVEVDAHRMFTSASARAWSAQTQTTITGEASSLPDNSLGNAAIKDIAEVSGERVFLASTARDLPEADLTGYAEARIARAALDTIHGSAKFPGSGSVKPTDIIEITNVGDRFGGNAYVTSVEHDIESGVWSTTAKFGLPQDWTSDSFGLAASGAEALTAPIHGVQIGVVISVAEDPEGLQRIKVSLPMICDPPAEVWARQATPYATAGAGFQFLPEVDDEVVVGFLSADPNAPVILGALHNGNAQRPETETTENYIKTIVTPTGMKLIFDDENQIITVETPGGHVFKMDDDATTVSMVDSNGNSITMDSGGITLKTDADITLTATGKIAAEATGDATLNGSNVTCEGQIGFTGKGGASAELSAGGTTTVKGAMVNIN